MYKLGFLTYIMYTLFLSAFHQTTSFGVTNKIFRGVTKSSILLSQTFNPTNKSLVLLHLVAYN